MDDLQLLELLEKAQKKQRGPQGATGVGIDSIDQFDGESFTIKLTTGESKKIALPIPKDGETGSQGVKGEKGDVGAEGKPGRPGADALPGAPGRDGAPGNSVDTAVVNSNGHLLLGLTDGTVIDVGRVVGPAGATGASGPTGLPGESGVDGLSVLSGPRTPQSDDGKEGDHWIDISSAEFGFYKKGGDGWSKLANLRQPAKDMRVGAGAGGGSGGGSGSGGGTAQTSATLPLANPTRGGKASKALPDVDGLKTQADYNSWIYSTLETLESSGGGGDTSDLEARVEALEKALLPYVEFTDENRSLSYNTGASYQNSSVRMYQYWNTSPAGEWMWAWMVKFPGSDTWTDVDDLSYAEQASIGYDGVEEGVYLFLYPSDPDDLPDIEVSLKVTDSLEGFTTVEGWSDPFFPRETWINQGVTSSSVAASTRPAKSGRGKLVVREKTD